VATNKLVASTVPVPDPTTLTTQSLLREISSLKELLEARINSTSIIADQKIEELKRTTDEIFSRIDVQFIERDKRTEQLAIASSTAIAAALQAAKEAVGAQNTSNSIAISKSETSTLESLRQLKDLFQADSKATNDKINDLRSRVDKGEGSHTGIATVWAAILGAGGLILAAVTLGVLLFRLHS
jgi:hypothetical protein